MVQLNRFEAVEIAIPSGSTNSRFYFPDLPNLRNALVQGIQLYTTNTLSATPNTGSNMVALADLQKSFITLYSGDLQLIYNMPILALNNIVNASVNPYSFEMPNINNMVISWVKSYISLPTAPTTTGVAYAFGVYYKF
jgi:hypothetical protein